LSAAICDVCDSLYLTRAGDPEHQVCHSCGVPLHTLTLAELYLWLQGEDEPVERRVSS
jgi:hypothetical protein